MEPDKKEKDSMNEKPVTTFLNKIEKVSMINNAGTKIIAKEYERAAQKTEIIKDYAQRLHILSNELSDAQEALDIIIANLKEAKYFAATSQLNEVKEYLLKALVNCSTLQRELIINTDDEDDSIGIVDELTSSHLNTIMELKINIEFLAVFGTKFIRDHVMDKVCKKN